MFVNCFEVCFKIFKISTCRYGTLCIRENPGCLFIATNLDAVGHMTDLQEWPGLPFFFSLFSLSSISMITWHFHVIIFLAFRRRMYGWCHIQFNWEEAYGGRKTINLYDGLFTTEVNNTSWIFYIISFYSMIFLWSLPSYWTLMCLFGHHNSYKLV